MIKKIEIEFDDASIKNISETVLRLSPLVLISLALATILSIYLKENTLVLLKAAAILYFLEIFSLGVLLEKSDLVSKFALREIANGRQREYLCMLFLSISPIILTLIVIG